MILYVPWIAALLASGVAAGVDWQTRRIPNVLTGPVLLAALIWATCTGGVNGLGGSLLGAAIAGGPFFLLWMIGGGGAGDAKLMIALGAWVGTAAALPLLLAVAVVGGLVSIGYALLKRTHGSVPTQLTVLLMSLPLLLAGASGGGGAR